MITVSIIQKLIITTLGFWSFSSFTSLLDGLFGNKAITNQAAIICSNLMILLPLLIGASAFISYPSYPNYLLTPSIFVSLAAFTVLFEYYGKRAHKYGNLTVGHTGSSVLIGMLTIYSTLLFVQDSNSAMAIMPFVLGATIASGFTASFAGVADAWHVVGTGQFQMISLDTAGIIFYFGLPLVILILRFFDKYEDFVHQSYQGVAVFTFQILESALVKFPFLFHRDFVYSSLVVFTLMPSVIGIPLVNSLCPIAGHLFGQVYLHGNPSTKCVAICINYSDLYGPKVTESSRQNIFKLLYSWKIGDKKNVSNGALNIIVTTTIMHTDTENIQKLGDAGHEIVLGFNGYERLSSLSDTIAVLESIKINPAWHHIGGRGFRGSFPSCYSMAKTLGLRSALWSLYVKSDSSLNKKALSSELGQHNGGSFIYISEGMKSLDLLSELLTTLRDEFDVLPTTLSVTAPKTSKMDL